MGLRLDLNLSVADNSHVSVPLPGFMGLRLRGEILHYLRDKGFSPVARIHGVATWLLYVRYIRIV